MRHRRLQHPSAPPLPIPHRDTGLGLAIVTRIMTLHQGKLHIVDAPTGGASMQLVWKNVNYKPPGSESLLKRWVRSLAW